MSRSAFSRGNVKYVHVASVQTLPAESVRVASMVMMLRFCPVMRARAVSYVSSVETGRR